MGKKDLETIFKQLKNYSKLHIPLLVLLIFRSCPRANWLSRKMKKKFVVMDRGQARFDRALDIRSILRVRQEINSLKRLLLSKQQAWLFQH